MKHLAALVLVFINVVSICGATARSGNSMSLPQITADEWRADFEFFKAKLTEHHPNPYFRTSKQEFERSFNVAIEKIKQRTSDQNLIALMQIVGLVRDGHTNVRVMGNSFKVSLIPVRPYLFDDGLYIVNARDPALVGARIISVNGHKIERVLKGLSTLISTDNEAHPKNLVPFRVIMPEFLVGLGFGTNPKEISLTIQKNGDSKKLLLPAVSMAEYFSWFTAIKPKPGLPISRSRNVFSGEDSLNIWKGRIEDAIYIQFTDVATRRDITLRDFSSGLKADFDRADRLIVDLRECPGGNKGLYPPFVSVLKNSKFNQSRNLFALTGRRTNSACTSLITKLRAETNVITVGERIGGSPLFYSDVTTVTSPNSKVQIEISTRYNLDSYFMDERTSHDPDIPVPLESAPYLAGRDLVLERALDHLPKRPSTAGVFDHSVTGRYQLVSGKLAVLGNENGSAFIRSQSLFDLKLTRIGPGLYRPVNGYDLTVAVGKNGSVRISIMGHDTKARRLRAGEHTPLELIERGKIDEGIERIMTIAAKYPDRPILGETELNRIGYRFLRKGGVENSIKVFEANVRIWPTSSNVYDSLGEAFLEAGELNKALVNYEKSVEINPQSRGGMRAIRKIKSMLNEKR